LKIRALLVQNDLLEALEDDFKTEKFMIEKDMLEKAHSAIVLSLGDKVLRQVS